MLDVITRSRYVTLAAYGTCFCGFMLYMGEPPSPKEPEKYQQHAAPTPVQNKGSADYQSPFKTHEKETAAPPTTPAPTPVTPPSVLPAQAQAQKETVKSAPPPPPKILDLSNDDNEATINFTKPNKRKFDFEN